MKCSEAMSSTQGKKKVGIMGGTFNPIHNGHLALANKAYDDLSLDHVLFVPSGKSYMKKHVLSTEKRVEMVKRAITPFPYFELSLIEINRLGNTYTCDTLQLLTNRNKNIHYYFILGADSLFQIASWKDPELIFSMATIVCAVRDEYDMNTIKSKGEELEKLGADIIYLDMPKIDISSSEIRLRVKNKLPYSELVPDSVSKFIQQEHLYEED